MWEVIEAVAQHFNQHRKASVVTSVVDATSKNVVFAQSMKSTQLSTPTKYFTVKY